MDLDRTKSLMLDATRYFSASYAEAKERFVSIAKMRGARLLSYPVGRDATLSIDVAIIGPADAEQTTVISSGLHGVEGFFGSAAQFAWLDQADTDAMKSRVVLIHAINPYGFANYRRWNEDNVDLNRNFHSSVAGYQGSPPSYAALETLLNPRSPPSRFEPFRLKAIWQIARMGLPAVKQAVAGGQYEYPQGVFYGGSASSESVRIVQANYVDWIGDSQNVIHLDLHTGLGRHACCKLLLEKPKSDSEYRWYASTFGDDRVETKPLEAATGTAYKTSGSFGSWLHELNASRNFRFALAEFGTYGVLRVLAALRAENRAHFYADDNSPCSQRAKAELVECFCPSSDRWRNQVISTAVEIIELATTAKLEPK
ncbi:MAG: DUF2817 domain-containing protein [Pirellulaceae bacterium]